MKMLKIKNKVNITGNIPLKYIFAWLKKCDVFVLPSRYEMPSNSLLEAMATGIPVVVSDFEGVEEIVENEQTGLISKMNDSDSLAESILRILNDESLGSRLASNAKRKAEKEFSASDNEAVFWEKVYLEAVDDFNKNNNYQS